MSGRGVQFKGGSLHDGLDGFHGSSGSGMHLAFVSLVPHITRKRGNCVSLMVLAVSAVLMVSVVTASPP